MKEPEEDDDECELDAKQARRKRFLSWCKEFGEDPEDESAWDCFYETDTFWERQDKHNLDGWTDNMNRD